MEYIVFIIGIMVIMLIGFYIFDIQIKEMKKAGLLYIKNPNYRCNRKKMIDDFSEIVFALFDSEN